MTRTVSDAMGDADRGAIQKFIDAMLHEFGGPIKMAEEVHREYEALNEGSQGRSRIMDRFLSLLEKYGATADIGEETLEEMEERLAELEGESGE